MKIKITLLAILALVTFSCSDENDSIAPTENKVLLLKVDYTTNVFEEGKELAFENPTDTFTINVDYVSPGDFGSITLYYAENDEKLFDGGIHWMGLGTISYPESFLPATAFEPVLTDDYVTPQAGYENIFNPNEQTLDYNAAWAAIQNRVKVREYLASNPGASVKVFLYTPSVGMGNPSAWDWIFILKN